MKNPILVPEFREYLSHNNIEALREICLAEHPAVVAEWLCSPADSSAPFHCLPEIIRHSSHFQGGLSHD